MQLDRHAAYHPTRSQRKIHHGRDITAALTEFRQYDNRADNQSVRLMKLMLVVNQQLPQPIYELPEADIVRRICEFGLTKENVSEIFATLNTFIVSPSRLATAQQIGLLALAQPTRNGLITLLGKERLLQLLMNDPALTLLDLSHKNLQTGDVESEAGRGLAVILKNAPHVKELCFTFYLKNYTAQDRINIFTELVNNTHLTAVKVLGEMLDYGPAILAQMTHLRDIDLSFTLVDADGARKLALNTNLKWLSLDDNDIGDEGAMAFRDHPSLETLIITDNSLTSAGMREVLQNTRLTTLAMIGGDDYKYRNLQRQVDEMTARNRACYSDAAVIAAILRNAFYEVMVPLLIKDILSYLYPATDKFKSRIARAVTFVETEVKPRQLREVRRRSAIRIRNAYEETIAHSYEYVAPKDLTLSTICEALLTYITAAENSALIEGGQYAREMEMALYFYPRKDFATDTDEIRILRLLLIMEGQLHCAIKQLAQRNPIRCLVQDVLLKLNLGELTDDLINLLLERASHLVTNAITVYAVPVGKRKHLLRFMSETTMLGILQQDETVTDLKLDDCPLDSEAAETIGWLLAKSRRLETVSIELHQAAMAQRFFGVNRREVTFDNVSEGNSQMSAYKSNDQASTVRWHQ